MSGPRKTWVVLVALVVACGPAASAEESSGTGGETSSGTSSTGGSTGDSTGAPTGDASTAATADATAAPTDTGALDDPCRAFVGLEACQTAGCIYTEGLRLHVDADGCRFGAPLGFCSTENGGIQAPTVYHGPGPDPEVVLFTSMIFERPGEGWKPCDCTEPDAPLACTCTSPGPQCPEKLDAHCGTLTDQATCAQFKAPEDLFYGCTWTEGRAVTLMDGACSEEALPGRCIAMARGGNGCGDNVPPASCSELDAQQNPYWRALDGVSPHEKIELLEMACNVRPIGASPCWSSLMDPAACECPCLPTL